MVDRTTEPQVKLPERLNIPQSRITTLENGIQLHSISAGTQQVIRLTLVFGAGTRRQEHPFQSSAMLNMLSEGSARYSAAEIAQMLDFYGIYYDTSIDRDYAMITISSLNRLLPETLDLLEEMLLRPTFPEKEFDIYRTKRKQQLKIEREKPSYVAREMFSVALFGEDHPYGRISEAENYDDLNVEMLREHWQRYYGADNLFAVTSGMVTPVELELIAGFLSKIERRNAPQDSFTAQAHTLKKQNVERADAVQSSIRIGKRLFTKGDPDFNTMQVLAMVLGGYFGSRLVTNLREERGYTYGVYSAMMNMKWDGYIAVATDVAAEATTDARDQIFVEIERLRKELIPEQELDMVRNIIVGEMMRILDGPFGIADVTIENIQSGGDNSLLHDFFDEVMSVTPERLREVAVRYLDPQSFTTVIVGAKV